MRLRRYAALLVAVCLLSGCGHKKVSGFYRDTDNAAVTYELREDGTWAAEMAVGAPSGVFPHGSDRRLEGNYRWRGDVIVLDCAAVRRRDPMTGEFAKEPGDPSGFNHRLRVEKDKLVPIGADGKKDAAFASDLNPLGARVLIRVGD